MSPLPPASLGDSQEGWQCEITQGQHQSRGAPWAAAGSQWGERVSGPGSLSRLGCSWHLGIKRRAPNFRAFKASFALKCLVVNKRCSSDNTAVLQSERSLPLHLSSATHAVSVLIPAPKGTCNYEPPMSPPAHILLSETFTEEGYLD